MRNKVIESNRFLAATSDSGKLYQIVEFQKFPNNGNVEASDNETEVVRKLVTTNGYPVQHIDAQTYRIIQTDEVVRKLEDLNCCPLY